MTPARADFNAQAHETWRQLYARQTPLRSQQMIAEFSEGLDLLGITGSQIPDLAEVNIKLRALTGWEGVFVRGLEMAESFFEMLADRKFPIGAFIRDIKDLSYTPEPDIFHDLYGHIPFFTIKAYADFCEEFGQRALKYRGDQLRLTQFQRLFWFTVEFAVIQVAGRRKIFGAGIASSFGECAYALSDKPQVVPFDLIKIRDQDFRIDLIQDLLFELSSQEQLYTCLDQFESVV